MRFTSFIIIPDRSSRSFTVRIPNVLLVILGVGFTIGICVIFVLGLFYNRLYQEATRAEGLARDNRELRLEVEKVRELDRQLREMRGLDIRLRQLMGQQIDPSLYGLTFSEDGGIAHIEAVRESLTNADGLKGSPREAMPTIWPVEGQVFISRIFTPPEAGTDAIHGGVDISVKVGSPVRSTAAGRIVFAGVDGDWGRKIEIDHGNGLITIYAHLSRLDVKVDTVVRKGDTIGLSGNSGRSTAPHLHYEVRYRGIACNPEEFLTSGEQ
jgi:murein DD-endopeptidase MepM/ murein hydrolase activator NlpD